MVATRTAGAARGDTGGRAMTADGGVAAAAGLEFQYLASVEALLDRLEQDDTDFTFTTEDPDSHVVDFAIDVAGRRALAAQAKSAVDGPDGPEMTAGELVRIAARLVVEDADRYLVRTNRSLSPGGTRFVQALEALAPGTAGPQVRAALSPGLRPEPRRQLDAVPDAGLERMLRLTVVASAETAEALHARVRERIRALRRTRSQGGGPE